MIDFIPILLKINQTNLNLIIQILLIGLIMHAIIKIIQTYSTQSTQEAVIISLHPSFH